MRIVWRAEHYRGYDRLYVPQLAYSTGDLDIHDISVDSEGRPVLANTRFGCLATVSERYSFTPLWHPPFITKLAGEDRCHLNGLACDEEGQPRYVTCIGRRDVADGRQEHRTGGGLLIDVERNEAILDTLSMPHSPRYTMGDCGCSTRVVGSFGYVDLERAASNPWPS